MATKRRKNFSLSDDVVEQLEHEPNQSQVVERLLRDHYDL